MLSHKHIKKIEFKLDSRDITRIKLACDDPDYHPYGLKDYNISCIFTAIKNNDIIKIEKYLIYGCPLNILNEYNLTPLQYASLLNNIEAIKIICEFKVMTRNQKLNLIKKIEK